MKELDFIKTIKETLTNGDYIGNDCADLKDYWLYVTQDSLVEGVHFDLKYITPYQLGQKAIAVNISDLATEICAPAYLIISLSMPEDISLDFVRDFYKGVNDSCNKYNTVVLGGDMTKSDKIYISVTAIGKRIYSTEFGRNFAQDGDFILSTGFYGTSAAGLYALQNDLKVSDEIIQAHLVPEPRLGEISSVGRFLKRNLAIMDTSDGLADALYKIAEASNVTVKVNFDEIPVLPEVKELAKKENIDLKDWVLWGGEDYEIIISVPYELFVNLDLTKFKYIASVFEREDGVPVEITNGNEKIIINEEMFNNKSFQHFKG